MLCDLYFALTVWVVYREKHQFFHVICYYRTSSLQGFVLRSSFFIVTRSLLNYSVIVKQLSIFSIEFCLYSQMSYHVNEGVFNRSSLHSYVVEIDRKLCEVNGVGKSCPNGAYTLGKNIPYNTWNKQLYLVFKCCGARWIWMNSLPTDMGQSLSVRMPEIVCRSIKYRATNGNHLLSTELTVFNTHKEAILFLFLSLQIIN